MTTILKSTTVDTPVVGTPTVSPSSDSSISISGAAVLVAIQLELLEIFMKNSKLMNEIASQSNQMALDAAGTVSDMVQQAGNIEAHMLRMQAGTMFTQAVVCAVQIAMQIGVYYTTAKSNNKYNKENVKIENAIKTIKAPDAVTATEGAATTTPTAADKARIKERIASERLYTMGDDNKISGEFSDREIAAIKSDDDLKEHAIGHLEKRKHKNTDDYHTAMNSAMKNAEQYTKIAEMLGKVSEATLKIYESADAINKAAAESLRTYMQSIIDILKSSANQGSETRQDLLSKVQQVLDLLEKLDSTNRFQR